MIENERQYNVAREEAAKLERILANFPNPATRPHLDPRLQQLERESVEDLLERVNRQLADYEAIVNSTRSVIFVRSLEELPSALSKAREMAERSVSDVARAAGISEDELRMYEQSQFASAPFALIVTLARVLDISLPDSIALHVPVSEGWNSDLMSKLPHPFQQSVEAARLD